MMDMTERRWSFYNASFVLNNQQLDSRHCVTRYHNSADTNNSIKH